MKRFTDRLLPTQPTSFPSMQWKELDPLRDEPRFKKLLEGK
ncbi:MAG: hypothetical protein NTW87_32630 [Planctomycetota bacterium]|nr:hypothetical protein [Planctomycetota bacterium]